jgi:PAS domain S-box-containing protein
VAPVLKTPPVPRQRRKTFPGPAAPVTRVLVVDEDAAQMKTLCDALISQSYSTTCLTSAADALTLLREQPFDLLLVDMNMTGTDVTAFFRAAREIDSDLVGIVITGQDAADNAAQAMEAGALDYIVKPFKTHAILPVLARARSVRKLRLENIHLQQAVGIYELSMVIRLTLDSDAVLQKVADAAMAHTQVSGVSILLPVDDGKALRVAMARGDNASQHVGKQVSFSASLSGWVERSLKRVSRLNELAAVQAALPLSLPQLPDSTSIAMLSGGRFVGILNFTSKNPGRPVSAAQIKALNVLASAAASALEAASLLDQLRSAERRYRSLSERAADIIFRYELYPQPHVGYINPASESVLGYSPGEYYADPGLILLIVHPDDRHFKEALLRGEFSSGSTVTLRCLNRNGNIVWIEQLITRVLDSDGRLIAIEAIARDITERKKLEEQLRQSQKLEAIGLLAGGLAHDFNNMLTVIMGYADLILDDDKPARPTVEKIGQVKKAAEHAAVLTGQLLAFGRRQLMQRRVLDVNSVVQRNADIFRQSIGEDIELAIDLEDGPGLIEADPGQIEQILMNLVVNASSSMPMGGKITIETKNVTLGEPRMAGTLAGSSGAHVMIAVTDTGCGMDAATLARVFEPFYTTRELGKGTGLGLSIIYGIVKQSAGDIRVFSEPGHGARFEILLPRSERTKERPSVQASPDLPSVAPEVLPGCGTILVVEDESVLRQLIGTILHNSGYDVLIARDGVEALDICRRHEGRIAMVLTDIVMPGMSGPAMVESLIDVEPGLRVLYMSGYAGDIVASERGLDPEIPFIQKPFTAANLVGKIREILGNSVAASPPDSIATQLKALS